MPSIRKLLNELDLAVCRLVNKLTFRLKQVECQTDFININGRVHIAGNGRISIGIGTRMNSGPRRNPIGGDTRTALICQPGGVIEIGANCRLSNCTLVAKNKVVLEAEVMVGGGVKIYDTDFHNIDPTLRLAERPGACHGISRPVLIRRNAFIGAHSIILKGVTVGKNSVVGAGSVVTQNIPDNEIWAGNPAKLLRKME